MSSLQLEYGEYDPDYYSYAGDRCWVVNPANKQLACACAGKPYLIGYRAVIRPIGVGGFGGAHLEAWVDTGTGFRLVGQGNNPCGKKFSVHPQAQVGIRIDNAWDSTMQCGGIRRL